MPKKKNKPKTKNNPVKPVIAPVQTINRAGSIENKRNIFNRILKSVNNLIVIGTTITGLTGYTIFRLLPDPELKILNPTDQNNIVIEVKNNSFLAMQRIRPKLHIDTLSTVEGDIISRLTLNSDNAQRLKLSRDQSYAFNYDFNTMFFEYNHPPQIFKAVIAISLEYKSLFIPCEDVFFFECQPDFHGNYLWVKAPEQSFVDEIKRDTTKASIDDIPYIRRMKDRTPNLQNVPAVPKSVLDEEN